MLLINVLYLTCLVFFFKQKTAYEMRISDWSSDVCSSDLSARFCMPVVLPKLPVLECVPSLRSALNGAGSAVLSAPPGSGKTTLIPLALLDEPWLADRNILVFEPPRVAARAAARRMASLLVEGVGHTAGYPNRFARRVSNNTRTQGIP